MTTLDGIESLQYVDMFGRHICVGDYIVYPASAGRSNVMRAGLVVELTHNSIPFYNGDKLIPKLRVRSWNHSQAGLPSFRGGRLSGRQKDVTLGYVNRVVVVPESSVSDTVKRDLAGPPHAVSEQVSSDVLPNV